MDYVPRSWESLAASSEQVPLTKSQKQEFDRRVADLEINPNNVLTWEEIKASVRGQR